MSDAHRMGDDEAAFLREGRLRLSLLQSLLYSLMFVRKPSTLGESPG